MSRVHIKKLRKEFLKTERKFGLLSLLLKLRVEYLMKNLASEKGERERKEQSRTMREQDRTENRIE